MRISLIGPPGVGKSAQAQRLSRTLTTYTPRIPAGQPVPDEAIMRLVTPHARRLGGWILDGFPTSLSQARVLDDELEESGGDALDHVILLEGPGDEELIHRILSGRLHSQATGMVYHLERDPPPKPEVRLDLGPFVKLDDDAEEAIRRRLATYHREADALQGHYAGKGILVTVDAGRSIEEVSGGILAILGRRT